MERIATLHDRALMLANTRAFFTERGVIEVDCPILSLAANIETHIDIIPACYNQKDTCYLHPSPEYGMKKLLSEGIGDIYQLSHVFRDGENSRKHNPEFMMIEWYRHQMSFQDFIDETANLLRLFLGDLPQSILTYRDLFKRFAGFDYVQVDRQTLLHYLSAKKIPVHSSIENESKDDLLSMILSFEIESQLGRDELCILTHYPSTQAALARTFRKEDEMVAERFEIYYKGIELCNGYHELIDPVEQRKRLHEANQCKIKLGKQPLPIDNDFLDALEKGLPDCCGVAVGFDRLMMLRHQTDNLTDVIPFRLKQ